MHYENDNIFSILISTTALIEFESSKITNSEHVKCKTMSYKIGNSKTMN